MTITYERVCDPARCGPVAVALGARFLSFDTGRGELRLAFDANDCWRNGLGAIQGGMLCAMLDFCCTGAALCALRFERAVPTVEIKTSFLAAATSPVLLGCGRALKIGRRIAFLEGELQDAGGRLLARATATALPQDPRTS